MCWVTPNFWESARIAEKKVQFEEKYANLPDKYLDISLCVEFCYYCTHRPKIVQPYDDDAAYHAMNNPFMKIVGTCR